MNMENDLELAMKRISDYGKNTKDPDDAYGLMNFALALSEEMYNKRKELGVTQGPPAVAEEAPVAREVNDVQVLPAVNVKQGLCPSCGKRINGADFRDEAARQECRNSGMCQGCQDVMFR